MATHNFWFIKYMSSIVQWTTWDRIHWYLHSSWSTLKKKQLHDVLDHESIMIVHWKWKKFDLFVLLLLLFRFFHSPFKLLADFSGVHIQFFMVDVVAVALLFNTHITNAFTHHRDPRSFSFICIHWIFDWRFRINKKRNMKTKQYQKWLSCQPSITIAATK